MGRECLFPDYSSESLRNEFYILAWVKCQSLKQSLKVEQENAVIGQVWVMGLPGMGVKFSST